MAHPFPLKGAMRDQLIKDYSAELQEDISHISSLGTQYGKDADDTITRYTERYERHLFQPGCIQKVIVSAL